jgi:hypothetical protein
MDTEFKGSTIEEFEQWYLAAGMPLRIPVEEDLNTLITDTELGTVMVVYRSGRFQAEMYLMYDLKEPMIHSHPNTTVIVYNYIPDHNEDKSGNISPYKFKVITYNTEVHGYGWKFDHVEPLIALQKWDEGIDMTQVQIQWEGQCAGPKHVEAIEKVYPGMVDENNFGDVRKFNSYYE